MFQSTPPARGATLLNLICDHRMIVSIHAPRTGGDLWQWPGHGDQSRFNPRPPHGGRLPSNVDADAVDQFQSTPPARGAT